MVDIAHSPWLKKTQKYTDLNLSRDLKKNQYLTYVIYKNVKYKNISHHLNIKSIIIK